MGNYWAYDVLVPAATYDEPDWYNVVFDVLTRAGLDVWNAVAGAVTGISRDGLQPSEWPSIEDTIASLRSEGGAVQTWRSDFDVLASFSPPAHESAPKSGWGYGASRHFGSFSLSTTSSIHTWPGTEGIELSRIVLECFKTLCPAVGSPCGYAYDENFAEEHLDALLSFHEYVYRRRPPPLIPWASYYSRTYFEDARLGTLWPYPQTVSTVGDAGYVIQLFDEPATVDLQRLRKLNRQWQSILAKAGRRDTCDTDF